MMNSSDPNAVLLWGLIEGNENYVIQSLNSGADVNMRSPSGSSPLHAAAFKGSAAIVTILSQKGIGVDEADNKGFTSLMVGAMNGHTDVVKKLLVYGADPNVTRSNGETALHLASDARSSRGVVTALLKGGADVNARTTDGKLTTPLHYAAKYNNLPMVKVLLSYQGYDARLTNSDGKTAAEVASSHGNRKLAQYLDLATSPPTGPNKDLTVAVLKNDLSEAKASLAVGADVNMCSLTGSCPLHVAARTGSLPLVQLLLNTPKVRVDQQDDEGYTPLMVAALNGHSDVVRELLIFRADPTRTRSNGETALHLASNCSSKGVASALLEYGADVNAKTNDNKMTPLHYAAKYDNHQLAEVLKNDSLCHLQEKDLQGRTAGEVALKYANDELALLLGHSVDTPDIPRPRPPTHLQPMDLRVVTGQPVSNEEKIYKCLSRPRGHVFVANYAKFSSEKYRWGSEQDIANLEALFTKMGYKVFPHRNLDLKKTLSRLDEFCSDESLKEVDAAVVCFLSHGSDERTFLTSDSRQLTVNKIQERFTDTRCPNLKGKPKLFLFNFCRGKMLEKGCIIDHEKDVDALRIGTAPKVGNVGTVEALKDSYTMYATVDGVMAIRNNDNGTYFIQYLTRVLAQHAHHEHVEELGTRLYNLMVKSAITTPDRRSNLAKKFYLNPTQDLES